MYRLGAENNPETLRCRTIFNDEMILIKDEYSEQIGLSWSVRMVGQNCYGLESALEVIPSKTRQILDLLVEHNYFNPNNRIKNLQVGYKGYLPGKKNHFIKDRNLNYFFTWSNQENKYVKGSNKNLCEEINLTLSQ